MTKILGTGLSGLVGSRVVELLSGDFEFESFEVDIRDKDKITKIIKNSKASLVLHLAAKTNVDGCEKDKVLGKDGDAWKVNVLGTQNVALACQELGLKMIYISTDFVFDGESTKDSGYTEGDEPSPINWYGKTKYEGELIVESLKTPYLIARLAYPYRVRFEKLDFVRAIINKLKNKEKIQAVSDNIFTPTFIDDVAIALKSLIESNAIGKYHVVGSQFLTPLQAANIICAKLGFDKSLVSGISGEEYFKNRAPRPPHLALSSDKIKKLGIKMRKFDEGLNEFARI